MTSLLRELKDSLKQDIDEYFELNPKESILDGHFTAQHLRLIADAMDKLKDSYVQCNVCGNKWQYVNEHSLKQCNCGNLFVMHHYSTSN